MPSKSSVFTRQPGKGVYTVYTVLFSLIRVPCLLIYYIPRSLRPHSKWTYYQAITNAISKIVFTYCAAIEIKTPRSVEPGRDTARFVLMHPADNSFYGAPLESKDIKPVVVGGIWLPSPYDAPRDLQKTVVLHFHGGAYVMLSPRMANVQAGPNMLVDGLSTPVLLVNYRLASNDGGCFPAALQDAVTAYKYVLDLGISPAKIVLSGDSAGGNLVLALLRYISENLGEGLLPCPGAALLWSPWADMSRDPGSVETHRNYSTDYIPSNLVVWGVRAYVPSGLSVSGPYFSPLKHPFATKAKIFVQAGIAEVLFDDIAGLATGMGEVKGNNVRFWRAPNANHDVFAAGAGLGFEPEARESVKEAGRFLEGSDRAIGG